MKLLLLLFLMSCNKSQVEPRCLSVTQIFRSTGETVIHWHSVCDADLARFKSYPKYSAICEGGELELELIIEKDNCKP